MKRTILRRLSALFFALLMLCSLVGCSSSGGVRASLRAEKAVAKAGNIKIPYENLYYMTMTRIAEMKAAHGEDVFENEAERAALESFVKENLITRDEALISVGLDYGLDFEKGDMAEEIEAQMSDVIENNFAGDRDAYIESLNAAFLTDRYVRSYIAVSDYLPTAIVNEMIAKNELDFSDEYALEIINGKNENGEDHFIRTVQVFIDKNNKLYSDEENRAHIKEIHDTVAAATSNEARYAAMAAAIGGKYNNDFGDLMGNGYYFARGEMQAAYEAVAFVLPEWGVSDVLETEDGFYVIMRLPKQAAYIEENLESLKGKIYFIVLNDKVDARLAELESDLEMTRFGKSLDYMELPAIDAGGGEVLYAVLLVGGISVGISAVLLIGWRALRKTRAKRG